MPASVRAHRGGRVPCPSAVESMPAAPTSEVVSAGADTPLPGHAPGRNGRVDQTGGTHVHGSVARMARRERRSARPRLHGGKGVVCTADGRSAVTLSDTRKKPSAGRCHFHVTSKGKKVNAVQGNRLKRR